MQAAHIVKIIDPVVAIPCHYDMMINNIGHPDMLAGCPWPCWKQCSGAGFGLLPPMGVPENTDRMKAFAMNVLSGNGNLL